MEPTFVIESGRHMQCSDVNQEPNAHAGKALASVKARNLRDLKHMPLKDAELSIQGFPSP